MPVARRNQPEWVWEEGFFSPSLPVKGPSSSWLFGTAWHIQPNTQDSTESPGNDGSPPREPVGVLQGSHLLPLVVGLSHLDVPHQAAPGAGIQDVDNGGHQVVDVHGLGVVRRAQLREEPGISEPPNHQP